MEDGAIIELLFARSERALDALTEKYGRSCTRLAGNLLGSPEDAEEVVNDAWLGVWNTIPPRRPQSLFGYVCKIVRNIAVSRYHQKTAKKRDSRYDEALEDLQFCLAGVTTVEEEADAHETARLINAFLETQDYDNRVMFMRRYWFGDSVDEIAKMFGTTPHYVSVRLYRIRQKLEEYLRKEGSWLDR